MRILGFSKDWPKLKKPIHTTFRYPRVDKDWQEGEIVQEVYKPRSKERKVLQTAKIVRKDDKYWIGISEAEAIEDGFESTFEMWLYLKKPQPHEVFNKLTLEVL